MRKVIKSGTLWIEQRWEQDRLSSLRAGTARGAWDLELPADRGSSIHDSFAASLIPFSLSEDRSATPSDSSPSFTRADQEQLNELAVSWDMVPPRYPDSRPFASAPVRSKPRRTYDPARPAANAEGVYIPMYLADVYFRDRQEWERIKVMLERFGRSAGLFDESPSGSSDPGAASRFKYRSGSTAAN